MPQAPAKHDPRRAGGPLRRAASGLSDGWKAQVTRRLAARGPVPDSFSFKPDTLVVGDPERAAALLRGQFALAGASARIERGDPWRTAPPSMAWSEALHGFGWLSHFRAADGEAARKAARRMTDTWLSRHAKAGGMPWRPPVTGDRVVAWCRAADLLVENAEPVYRSDLFRSLAAQARYLRRTAVSEGLPTDRLRAALGIAYAGLCVSGEGEHLAPGLDAVIAATRACLLPDGGPVGRNPSDLLMVLHALVQLRDDMKAAGEGALAGRLTAPIERAAPVLRMMRHGAGGLALFHGGRAGDSALIDLVLVESDDRSAPPDSTADAGYLRLSAGGAAAVIDAGAPAEGPHARRSHAAPLAMSLSSGGRPVIVNCGSGAHLGPEWEGPCRASAAHSALTVDERSPCDFDGRAGTPHRRITRCARIVEATVQRNEDGIWALAAHDGYAGRYGLIHYRQVFLDADGVDLRGEDTLTLAKGGARTLERSRARRKTPDGPRYAIRFHLHPEVGAAMEDGKARLTLPDGEEWRMIQSGGKMRIEDSVYIPDAGAPQSTRQVVIESSLRDTEGQVRWALKRETGLRVEAADAGQPEEEAEE